MLSRKLKNFLDAQKVSYEVINVPQEHYTTPEIAADLHLSGKKLAKVVIVIVGNQFVMAVLPSHEKVVLPDLARAIRDCKEAKLARENEFQSMFTDCRIGSMPPFGNLYGLAVYVDEHLTRQDEIYFEGGSHSEIVKMKYQDFARLVNPIVAQFGAIPRAA